MVAFKTLAISLLLGLVAAFECPALSNTFGMTVKKDIMKNLKTVDCRVGIQAAECAINVKPSAGQTWGAFRIDHLKDTHHGAPYGQCCLFAGAVPTVKDMQANLGVWLFFWDSETTGQNKGPGTGCIKDPTNGCCGRQDRNHFTTTGGCAYEPSVVAEQFGRVNDGCPSKKGDPKQQTLTPDGDRDRPQDTSGGGNGIGNSGNGNSGNGNSGRGRNNGNDDDDDGGGGARLARFARLARRWARDGPSSNKKDDDDDDDDDDHHSTGGGGDDDNHHSTGGGGDDDNHHSGPGGFPKCGPRAQFPSSNECKSDGKSLPKPTIPRKPVTAFCLNDDVATTGLRGAETQSTKEDPTQQDPSQQDPTQNTPRKRWAGSGGNQWNRGNTGQLKPGGKCCWCEDEK